MAQTRCISPSREIDGKKYGEAHPPKSFMATSVVVERGYCEESCKVKKKKKRGAERTQYIELD
jgi:hypothetical protein